MKNHKTRGDRDFRSQDWSPDVPLERDDTYAWLSQMPLPPRRRWLVNHAEHVRRFRDNEGWDDDRMNELRRAGRPGKRIRRDGKRFYDEVE